MSESLYYSDFLKSSLEARARKKLPIVDELEKEIRKSEELELIRVQFFMEQELIKSGIVRTMLESTSSIPDLIPRYYPRLVNQENGLQRYYVVAEWPQQVSYSSRKQVRTASISQLVGEGAEDIIWEGEDFTISQTLLVASQIDYLRGLKQTHFPHLDDSYSAIAT